MEYQMDLEKSFMRAMHQVAAKDLSESQLSEQYEALGALIREQIGPIWQETKEKQEKEKSVYYFSMEFLTGKFTQKNLEYLDLYEKLCDFFAEKGLSLQKVLSIESEPGLGNGGLGRLAAAFLDSLSSLSYSGHGYGIRYEKGLFKQRLDHGYQTEEPDNWLDQKNIWEYPRFDEKLKVRFGGRIRVTKEGEELKFHHVDYEEVYAIPYDIPVIGYKNGNINTLRLWSAKSVHDLNFHEFSSGNLSAAFHEENKAKSICQILYPNDSYYEGKKLRLKQEYFLVSAGMQDLIRKVEKRKIPLKELPRYIAIHINDTHPAMAIPELMRILLDEYELEWVEAWDITVKTCAFTNHTLLEEAMEKWDINLFREVVPRIWQITEEINNRFLDALRNKYQVTAAEEIEKLSIIQYGTVRMVNLSIVGTHSINGVAKLHSDILRTKELKHFARLYPDRFNNKTNGIVHRHWLLTANKQLTAYIEELIGDGFKTDPKQLKELLKFEDNKEVLDRILAIKQEKKEELAEYIFETTGVKVNPYSIFDIHTKRIHEYKRQLMNILHIIYLYGQLKENPNKDMVPRTFIFSGKAAPGYYIAKEIIKLINTVAKVVNDDLTIKGKIKVLFLENYNVDLASKVIPAADVSEQISTATKEASGTGNMKYMMNGAVTLATLDGANIEIANEVGENNIFIFGLKEKDVYDYYQNGKYDAQKIYSQNKWIKDTLDKLVNGYFKVSYGEFQQIFDSLVKYGDRFFVLEDLMAYREAQVKINQMYRNKYQWATMSLRNIACSGAFSSDSTIEKYAKEIWEIKKLERERDAHEEIE